MYLEKWKEEFINKLKEYNIVFKSIVDRFGSKLNDENIITIYMECRLEYKDGFWELIDKYKAWKRILEDKIFCLLEQGKINIHDFFKYQKLVEVYGKAMKEFLMS